MKTFEYWFENEQGIVENAIEAENYEDAVKQLKEKYPNDQGSDGQLFWSDESDNEVEKFIDW